MVRGQVVRGRVRRRRVVLDQVVVVPLGEVARGLLLRVLVRPDQVLGQLEGEGRLVVLFRPRRLRRLAGLLFHRVEFQPEFPTSGILLWTVAVSSPVR